MAYGQPFWRLPVDRDRRRPPERHVQRRRTPRTGGAARFGCRSRSGRCGGGDPAGAADSSRGRRVRQRDSRRQRDLHRCRPRRVSRRTRDRPDRLEWSCDGWRLDTWLRDRRLHADRCRRRRTNHASGIPSADQRSVRRVVSGCRRNRELRDRARRHVLLGFARRQFARAYAGPHLECYRRW